MPEDPLIDRFVGEHFTLNSISAQRQQQVLAALSQLEMWLGHPLIDLSPDELRGWMVALLERGLAPSTVAWYMRMVLPFFQWAWETRIIDADHLMRLRAVKAPRGSSRQAPRPYSRKELMQMWAQLDARWPLTTEPRIKRWRNGTSHFRNVKKHAMRLQLNAIIELALVCGLRRGEIYRLSIDDVHWDNKYIVVHGKRQDQNDKVREVPYPDSTRTAIREWFRMRGYMGPQPGQPLWLSITGPDPTRGLSPERMATILHSFGNWHLHRLRHTCATERLRAGMDLEKLQRFLGHATVQQTLGYAQLVRGDIHKASERIDDEFQRAIKPAA